MALEMKIAWWAQCNHRRLYKRKRETGEAEAEAERNLKVLCCWPRNTGRGPAPRKAVDF